MLDAVNGAKGSANAGINDDSYTAAALDAVEAGIDLLCSNSAATLVAIDPKGEEALKAETFQIPQEIEAASRWVRQENVSGKNCYFHPNSGSRTNQRQSGESITHANFFWLDKDPDIKSYGSYNKAREQLLAQRADLSKNASIVVDSGNGLQIFFRLRQPLEVSDEQAQFRYEAINRCIAKKFHADNTQDCSHLMRLPGTINYPNATKLKKGYPSTPSKATMLKVDEVSYSVDDIVNLFDISEAAIQAELAILVAIRKRKNAQLTMQPPVEIDALLQKRFDDFLAANPKAMARHTGYKDDLTDKSGSAMDMSMATMMLFHGFSMPEIRALLASWKHGATNSDRSSDRYWGNIKKNSSASDYEITEESKAEFWAQMYESAPGNEEVAVLAQEEPLSPVQLVNKQYAWDGTCKEIYDIEQGRYIQVAKFCANFENVSVAENGKSITLGRAWMKNSQRRLINGLCLAPNAPEVLPNGALNTWQGFAVESISGDVEPFLDVLSYVLFNESERKYALLWLARMIQKPGEKFHVALVVWSLEEGVGKGLVFETVGELFNPRHHKVVGNEVFDDQFNDWQSQKVYVVADEVSSTDKRTTADRIKGWVTASHNNINVKHSAKFAEHNIIKYVFLSNHPDAVYLNDKDRRFFVCEGPDKKIPDSLRLPFLAWKANGGLSHLRHYLESLDTTGFDPKAHAPVTESKLRMVDSNKSDLEVWIESKLEQNHAAGIHIAAAESLQNAYNSSSRASRVSVKAVTNILKQHRYVKLKKKARLPDTTRRGVFVAKDKLSSFENLTDTQLGDELKGTLW